MKTPLPHKLRSALLLAFAGTALAASVVSGPSADARGGDGLLAERAFPRQDVGSVLHEGVVQKLRCDQNCLVSGRVTVAVRRGSELGANRLRPGRWARIARLQNLRLKGGSWYVVRLPLSRAGARVVRRARGEVRLQVRNLAVSLESGRYERSGWARTLAP